MLDLESQARIGGRDLLRRTARTPVAQVAEGAAAKIVGRVACHEQRVSAALSSSACAAYEITVRTIEGDRLAARTTTCTFLVEDETGRVLIASPSILIVNHGFSLYQETGLLRGPSPSAASIVCELLPPDLAALLLRDARMPFSLVHQNRLGFGERRIGFGETVAVFGTCTWEADPDLGRGVLPYRRNHARLKLEGTPVLVASDRELLK